MNRNTNKHGNGKKVCEVLRAVLLYPYDAVMTVRLLWEESGEA